MQTWWGNMLGWRCLSLFQPHSSLIWSYNVALGHHYREPWWKAIEADSDNQYAFILSLPGDLMNFFFLPQYHCCHRKDGDNYLAYYPEAVSVIPGNRRLISIIRSPE